MANFTYLSMWDDVVKANIDFVDDTFKMMLVGSGYTASEVDHTKLSDVSAYQITGVGYGAGGATLTTTVVKDTGTKKIYVYFNQSTAGQVVWPSATLSDVRGAVIYKSRGGAASADELVHWIDFPVPMTSQGGNFVVTLTTPIIIG